MLFLRNPNRRERVGTGASPVPQGGDARPSTPGSGSRRAARLLKDERGAALLEFAISLPLLVAFVVAIFDFSGAADKKQKIEQAAQEGAIVAGAQPMSDIQSSNANPDSLQPVVVAIFNSLADSGVLPNANTGGGCLMPPPAPTPPVSPALLWTYTITGCSPVPYSSDQLIITINRGWVTGTAPAAVGTTVTVSYPYHWPLNSVFQLLVPAATYTAQTTLIESSTVHNQM
jgi:TadE-like protein